MAPKTPYQTVVQVDAELYDHNDASPPDPQRVLREHPFHDKSDFGDSKLNRMGAGSTQWSVGLMTPFVIIGFFVLATVVAIAHFLYCHFLDQKFVDDTIPQSWNAALSVAIARAFSVTMAASASTAFTQLLWWHLRRKALSLSKIDALFSLNTSPTRLYELGLLTTTPLLWFFGLLLPLISIATIFPPGSLVVQQLPDARQLMMQVPTLDIDYRGNGSAAAFFEFAAFQSDIDGNYVDSNVQHLSIGRRTFSTNTVQTRPSPCGANCSYTVSFSGPGFRCGDNPPPLMDGYHRVQYNATMEGVHSAFNVSYRAREGGGAQWLSNGNATTGSWYGGLRNISCQTQDTTYSAHVRYTNFIQDVTLKIVKEEPVEQSVQGLDIENPFYPVLESTALQNGSINASSISTSLDDVYKLRHYYQILALRDSLVRPMAGYVIAYGDFQVGVYRYNTTIQETPFADPVYDARTFSNKDIYFKLSPSIVEQLMRNITISMLNDATTNATANVTTTIYKAAYEFQDKPRLIVVYAVTLGVCLIFVLLGLFALYQNGTPAYSGGFLQILCTTAHGESLINHLAKEASFQGTEHIPKDLAHLKVRYGLVADSGSEKKFAAFGTVEETEVLIKGSSAQK